MREKRYICGICGKENIGLDNYLKCVSTCGEKLKKEKEEAAQKKYLEEVNTAINKIKQTKKYYEEQLDNFKHKYPEEYKMNFAMEDTCEDICDCIFDCKSANIAPNNDVSANNTSSKNDSFNTMSVKVKSNGKDKPTVNAKINGKKVEDEKLASLFADPDVNYLAKLLGIL